RGTVAVTPGTVYTVTVGAGGIPSTVLPGRGGTGGTSQFIGDAGTSVLAVGGQGGVGNQAGETTTAGGTGGQAANCIGNLATYSGGNGGHCTNNSASPGGGGGQGANSDGNGVSGS